MPELWIDRTALEKKLADFFESRGRDVSRFGSTVNQTFEAFVFAATLSWYRSRGWSVTIIHPKLDDDDNSKELRLKFSTRGRPGRYSHAVCRKGDEEAHVRHQLRVATRWHTSRNPTPANICLDVAVIKPINISHFSTYDYLPNDALLSFGEAKHMSAFAELLESFLGLVHELQPERLKRIRVRAHDPNTRNHPAPFLYVSGQLYTTAEGVLWTMERRKYDLDVYWNTHMLSSALELPQIASTKRRRKTTTTRASG